MSKAELFSASDFLAVNCLLNDATRGMVGAAELRSMKPTAYLVNTARGPIVQETALIQALQEHWIAGAGLDVFEQEPCPRLALCGNSRTSSSLRMVWHGQRKSHATIAARPVRIFSPSHAARCRPQSSTRKW